MSVELTRPPVGDLVFAVYGKPLHPELFDVLAVRRVRHQDYELTVQITRTGHVISWQNADVCLTEVAAASDDLLPERRLLARFRLRGERTHTMPCTHQVCYQAAFQVERMKPEVFLHVHDEIVLDGGRRGLLHHFTPHNRLSRSALGFVNVEVRPGCLFLSTFHTFPGENTVVKTQSLIERP